ncbi:MAG: hypothetical protein KJ574_02600 [Nanoarchaeota archaeon]|nr:hypothetical protein [Nanoarchaeota archaeon]
MNNRFKLKKYAEIDGFTVWIVDGNYVRARFDYDFTNFGQHCRFPFIPQDEFWIDKQHESCGEEDIFIKHLLVEQQMMKDGSSFDEAYDVATELERKIRQKNPAVRALMKKNRKSIISKIHKQLWKKYSAELEVWIVDGKLVRDLLYIDFVQGGHDRVYKFVPKNEIWIESAVPPKERKLVLLHEIHERNLMAQGWSYYLTPNGYGSRYVLKSAHTSALEVESFCRKNPKELEKKLAEEISLEKVGQEYLKKRAEARRLAAHKKRFEIEFIGMRTNTGLISELLRC